MQKSTEHSNWEIFKIFFWISALTPGGGLAMLPLIQREIVDKRHWLSQEEMMDTIVVMQSLPGIIVMNLGILLGHRINGVGGAISAVAGATLPPFAVILLLARFLLMFQDRLWLQDAFLGIRSSVCALILLTAIKLLKNLGKKFFPIVMTVACFLALVVFQINAFLVIVMAAVLGCTVYFLQTVLALRHKAKDKKI